MAAAAVLSVGGAARDMVAGSLRAHLAISGRSTLRAGVRSLDGSYIPDQDDEVELEDASANTLFKGLLTDPDQDWLVPNGEPLITTVNAEDFTGLANRRLVAASTTGGITGRDAIDYVVTTYLATYGVTRDPSMPAGATLGALSYTYATAMDVINDIVRLAAPSGWVWRIDENKVLTAWAPSVGTLPCPWSMTASSSKIAGGDIKITRSREHYANRVILRYTNDSGAEATATADDAGEQATHGLYESVLQSPGPFDASTAAAVVAAYLARLVIRPLTIQFRTREPGARPGQTLTVNLPVRNLTSDFLITDIAISDFGGQHLVYDITAVEGGTLAPSWKDTYREWSGSGSGLAVVGGTIVVSTGAEGSVSLGGATAQGLVPGAGTYARVVNAIPFVATRTGSALVRVELWARSGSVTVTARLRDLTTAATAGTSSGVTGSTPTLTSFAAPITAGRRYELQLTSDTAGAEVYGVGSLVSI